MSESNMICFDAMIKDLNLLNPDHIIESGKTFRNQYFFVKNKAGYEMVEAAFDKYSGESNSNIAIKYGIGSKEVDSIVEAAMKNLAKYNIIGEIGYDACESKGLLAAEFVQCGITPNDIRALTDKDIWTPIQFIEVSSVSIPKSVYNRTMDALEQNGYIDSISESDVKKKEAEPTIGETISMIMEDKFDNYYTFAEYKAIFDPIHKMVDVGEVKTRKSISVSNKILKQCGVKFTVAKDGQYIYIVKNSGKEVTIMSKKKVRATSNVIADKRETYPYGVLYGAFSPKEQNHFPNKYVDNTKQLLEYLSTISKDVRAIVDNTRDNKSYSEIESYYEGFDISTARNKTFELVRNHKDAIISGFERSSIVKDGFAPYKINPLTTKSLVSVGIYSIDQINMINNMDELLNVLHDVQNKQVVVADLMQSLNEQNYDTTRFGFYGKAAETVEEHPTAEQVHNDKLQAIEDNRNVVAERKQKAADYLMTMKDIEMDEAEFNYIINKYVVISRGIDEKDVKKFAIKSTSFDTYCNLAGLSHRHTENGKHILVDKNTPFQARKKTSSVETKPVVEEKVVETPAPVEEVKEVIEKKEEEVKTTAPAQEAKLSVEETLDKIKSMGVKTLVETSMDLAAIIKGKCPNCGAELRFECAIEAEDENDYCSVDLMDNFYLSGTHLCKNCLQTVKFKKILTFIRK